MADDPIWPNSSYWKPSRLGATTSIFLNKMKKNTKDIGISWRFTSPAVFSPMETNLPHWYNPIIASLPSPDGSRISQHRWIHIRWSWKFPGHPKPHVQYLSKRIQPKTHKKWHPSPYFPTSWLGNWFLSASRILGLFIVYEIYIIRMHITG